MENGCVQRQSQYENNDHDGCIEFIQRYICDKTFNILGWHLSSDSHRLYSAQNIQNTLFTIHLTATLFSTNEIKCHNAFQNSAVTSPKSNESLPHKLQQDLSYIIFKEKILRNKLSKIQSTTFFFLLGSSAVNTLLVLFDHLLFWFYK